MKSFSFTFFLFLIATCAGAQTTVYLKPAQALETIFASSDKVIKEKKTLNTQNRAYVAKKYGAPIKKETWTFYKALTGKRIDGYALIDHEIGKVAPITFLTAMDKNGKIKAIEVLVYRESHGSEVHQKRFTKQFLNKTPKDSLHVGKSIKHISGATLSSRAMTRGARKALALWEVFYGQN